MNDYYLVYLVLLLSADIEIDRLENDVIILVKEISRRRQIILFKDIRARR
jgi:hypothetical protein